MKPVARFGIACLMLAATQAYAGNPPVCVDSGISLRAALINAANNVGDNEIRIRQGTLTLFDNTLPYDTAKSGNLLISGGWTGAPGQCTSRSGGPTTTVIDGEDNRQLFRFELQDGFSGQITLMNLTVAGGYRASTIEASSIQVWLPQASTGSVLIERVIVRDNDPYHWGQAVRLGAFGEGVIHLRNSLIVGNSIGQHGAVTATAAYNGSIYLTNNTIADNQRTAYGTYATTGLELAGNGVLVVSNNVVVGNLDQQGNASDAGMHYQSTADVSLRNNHLGTFAGTPTVEQNTSTGLDVFDARAPYRPKGGSALVDSGTMNAPVPMLDLDGWTRTIENPIDRGAYELERLFAHGFDD